MRIHALTIDNFRAIEHLELRDIPDRGVVVIYGDNEQGKSSILEALDVVLTVKYKAKNKRTNSIQPVDRDVPFSIKLDATVGDVHFIITKRFLKSPSAELQILSPRPANHRGDDAEATLADILESHLDKALLDALFMKQGEVEAGINAVGIPSLTSALNAQNGGTTDATEDTALMEAVEAEYLKYFTAKGKQNARYTAFFDAVEGLQEELDTHSAAVASLSSHVDRVERLKKDRDQAQAKLPDAEEERALRRSELDAALKVKIEADEAAAQYSRASEQLDYAVAAKKRREALNLKLAEAASALEHATAKRVDVEAYATQETERFTALNTAVEDARTADKDAVAAVKSAGLVVANLKNRQRKEELTATIDEVEKVEEKLLELRSATHSSARISQRDIDDVQEATNALDVQTALVAKQSGSVALTAQTPTDVQVDNDTFEITDNPLHFSLSEELTVTVTGVTMVIDPGVNAEKHRAGVLDAQAHLDGLLVARDVPDVATLRERFREQQQRDSDIATLETELRRISGGVSIAELKAERDGLMISELPADVEVPSSLEDAQRALEEATARREETSSELEKATAALDGLRARPAEKNLIILDTQLSALRDNVEVATTELNAALAESSDEDIEAAVATAQKLVDGLRIHKSIIDAQLAKTNPGMAEQLFNAAENNLNAYKETIKTADSELLRLEGFIRSVEGAKERFDKVESALRAAENRRDSEERRANAAKRLRDLMVYHRDESRKRYAAPFADKLSRLAAQVFGENTDFDLNDKLEISSRSIGPRTVDVDHLSGGAHEQLAILTRFAIAELVAESSDHGAVPVFIDDALGSTDPERLSRISTLFSQAGLDSQVFVLTCVPDRYNYVDVVQKHSIESLKAAATLK
ncbi:DNA repair ATPase [Corynebacterium deserti GIMN1.010]|uniref:DNA repair ATPase n=1 Tax=Corynebacterium deserti GIMN1.010 TaxID=931089 RepID=A0A0M4CXD0_9CORY|nr:AAA family ATPase [Corynebacterium deserti]ALC05570.1 DNA repair ATPase [Corynebacterium deserti GIMN1.010]